jgi:DNA replication protein DnaC
MEDLIKVMEEAVELSAEGKNNNDSDYEKDGLLYCGLCNTPKQHIIKLPWGERKPRVNCQCEQAKVDEIESKEKATKHKQKVESLRGDCFPTKSMWDFTFENDNGSSPEIMTYARNYVKDWRDFYSRGKGLLIYGSVGIGKTYASCCIANALMENEIPCKFTDFSRIGNELHETWAKQEYLDSFDQYPLVIVDDLGVARRSEYMNEMVYNFIQHRCLSGLPLIVTSNLTKAELRGANDINNERIYSRLFQMCTPIMLKGEDLRKDTTAKDYADDMRKLRGEQNET